MFVEKAKSLFNLNTFGMNVEAKQYIKLTEEDRLPTVFQTLTEPFLVLGGGSNILFTQNFEGLVIHNQIKGISLISEDESSVLVEVGAGENWHEFVLHCIENNWYGIENLSLIPGTVGASPIQNIGAYGIEVKDVIEEVTYYSIPDDELKIITASECGFGYRDSIFKNNLKGTFVITKVKYRLSKSFKSNISYGAITQVLEEKEISVPTAKDVSDAVVSIRQSKLPNPEEIGNAGSFFKNPVIPITQFVKIKEKFPDIVYYPVDDENIKVPAGWLIDQAGWKGEKRGVIGVHDKQALVLVNRGGGKGLDVKKLAFEIINSIKDTYGIVLTPEVNIL